VERVLVIVAPGWSHVVRRRSRQSTAAGVRPQDAARRSLWSTCRARSPTTRAAERDRRHRRARLHGDGTDGRVGSRITPRLHFDAA